MVPLLACISIFNILSLRKFLMLHWFTFQVATTLDKKKINLKNWENLKLEEKLENGRKKKENLRYFKSGSLIWCHLLRFCMCKGWWAAHWQGTGTDHFVLFFLTSVLMAGLQVYILVPLVSLKYRTWTTFWILHGYPRSYCLDTVLRNYLLTYIYVKVALQKVLHKITT